MWRAAEASWKEEVLSEGSGPGFCGCDFIVRNGRLLVAVPGKELSQIHLFDASGQNSKTPLCVLTADHKYGSATCLKFGSNATNSSCSLFVGYESGHLVAFDARAGHVLSDLSVHQQQPVMCLDYDAQNALGVSGSPDDALALWRVPESNEERDNLYVEKTVKLTNAGVAAVKVRSRDGKVVVSGGWDGRIRYFSWKKGAMKPLAVLNIHRDTVSCLDFDDNGNLAAGSRDGLISLWNLYT
jgi:WD40 repeat protein